MKDGTPKWADVLAMSAEEIEQFTPDQIVDSMVNDIAQRAIEPLVTKLCTEIYAIKRVSLRRQAKMKGRPGWRGEFHVAQDFGFRNWMNSP